MREEDRGPAGSVFVRDRAALGGLERFRGVGQVYGGHGLVELDQGRCFGYGKFVPGDVRRSLGREPAFQVEFQHQVPAAVDRQVVPAVIPGLGPAEFRVVFYGYGYAGQRVAVPGYDLAADYRYAPGFEGFLDGALLHGAIAGEQELETIHGRGDAGGVQFRGQEDRDGEGLFVGPAVPVADFHRDRVGSHGRGGPLDQARGSADGHALGIGYQLIMELVVVLVGGRDRVGVRVVDPGVFRGDGGYFRGVVLGYFQGKVWLTAAPYPSSTWMVIAYVPGCGSGQATRPVSSMVRPAGAARKL